MLDKSPVFSKLHSKSGASLMLALLFIVICIMVGTVVLVAAGIGIERVDASREQEQTYISLRSAADLINEGMAGLEFSETVYTIEHTCPDRNESGHVSIFDTVSTQSYQQLDNQSLRYAIGSIVSEAIKVMKSAGAGPSEQLKWTFHISNAVDGSNNKMNVDSVEAIIVMDKNFNIQFVIQAAEVDAANNYNYLNYAPVTLVYRCTQDSAEKLLDVDEFEEKTLESSDITMLVNNGVFDSIVGFANLTLQCTFTVQEYDVITGTYIPVDRNYSKILKTKNITYSWELTEVIKGEIS